MLFRPKDLQQKVGKLLHEAVKANDPAGLLHILELDRHCGPAYLGLGKIASEDGRLEEAEQHYWNGLAQQPCSYVFYFALSQVKDGELSRDLTALAFRKMSNRGASAGLVDLLNETMGQAIGVDFNNPEAFGLVAGVMESAERQAPADPRLRPYLLLQRLQEQADGEVEGDLIRQIRSAVPEMPSVLEGVLHEWAQADDAIGLPSLCLSVALLGEIGPVSALENLLDVTTVSEPVLFLHGNWAVYRLCQRFPREALEQFRARIPSASVALRCGMAEQLSLMPPSRDAASTVRLLLEGFVNVAQDEDAAYLLAAGAYALEVHDCGDEGAAALAYHRGSLSKEGQELLDAYDESGFLPRLVEEKIDEADIRDVCIDRIFMDADDAPPPAPPAKTPGRNDPCWCGSGKKYKKCHLSADEGARRTAAPPEIRNYEGDRFEFCVAVYRCADEDRAIAGLLGCPEFEELEAAKNGTRSIAWLEAGDADARRSYGTIAIRGGRLRLECNSKKRLERGRALIEKYAGDSLEHLGDSLESVTAAMKRTKE